MHHIGVIDRVQVASLAARAEATGGSMSAAAHGPATAIEGDCGLDAQGGLPLTSQWRTRAQIVVSAAATDLAVVLFHRNRPDRR
jgi:hypothetical protein